MRPASLRLLHVTRPPARPSLWIAVTDAAGTTGWGEASPLPPFSRDDVPGCARALEAVFPRLAAIDESAAIGPALAVAFAPVLADLKLVPSAAFALEAALLDLLGRRRGLSVAALLSGGSRLEEVPVNALLIADPPGDLADRAARLAELGYRALKIKLRARDEAGFDRELAALHAVRSRLPLPFELRLDPNGAWSIAEARRRLAALAPLAPRYVEQPVSPADLVDLGRCAVPWAADESLANAADHARLARDPGCGALVLKPAILGGLLVARELALLAHAHGKPAVVTHLFDGPIALAAAAELALSLPAPALAAGLDPHDHLGDWPAIVVPQLARRGAVIAAKTPGLGLDLQLVDLAWIPST
ncbi:MAG: enolase C-terminal domain-like protein [Byssovorax sp.]